MKCSQCNNEMEKGFLTVTKITIGRVLDVAIKWCSVEKSETGILGRSKRKKFYIQNRNCGRYSPAYYCGNCGKVFAEFYISEIR